MLTISANRSAHPDGKLGTTEGDPMVFRTETQMVPQIDGDCDGAGGKATETG
jgi:hypothetical protein